jgi:hypothetical protein
MRHGRGSAAKLSSRVRVAIAHCGVAISATGSPDRIGWLASTETTMSVPTTLAMRDRSRMLRDSEPSIMLALAYAMQIGEGRIRKTCANITENRREKRIKRIVSSYGLLEQPHPRSARPGRRSISSAKFDQSLAADAQAAPASGVMARKNA